MTTVHCRIENLLHSRQYMHVRLSKLTDTHDNSNHFQMMHFDNAIILSPFSKMNIRNTQRLNFIHVCYTKPFMHYQ